MDNELNPYFKVSSNFGHDMPLDFLYVVSKYAYYFCKKDSNDLAPGDYGKFWMVIKENKNEVYNNVLILSNDQEGILVDAVGAAGKIHFEELQKAFDLRLHKDVKEGIKEWLKLSKLTEFIKT